MHSRKHGIFIRFSNTPGNLSFYTRFTRTSKKKKTIFIFGSHALPETWHFYSVLKHSRKLELLYSVHTNSQKKDNFYIRFTCTPGNMVIFIFGSHVLPKTRHFYIRFSSTLENMRFFTRFTRTPEKMTIFFIWYTGTPGNMTIFIVRFHTLPETYVYILCRTLPKTKEFLYSVQNQSR